MNMDGKTVLITGSTDGVGTKILIAAALRRYDTVGADLVNHCVDDILVTGADPLFFLDYLAVGKLDPELAAQVVAGAPAGVVISPGPCAPAEAGISVATVTACAAAGVPLLGICLGHQAIGAAFGAGIIAAPRPVHGTAFPVTHDGAGVFRGLPSPFQATRYHSLIVDEATLPPDLLVTARTDGMVMAVSHRTRPIEGVQFHPESVLTAHGPTIIANFVTAAHALGVNWFGIMFRHIFRNGLAPVLVPITFGIASAILIESALSFLGFGAPPPNPSPSPT